MAKKLKYKPSIEDRIYKSIVLHCERMESKNIFHGNGHHLAQRLSTLVAEGLLPEQQKKIYDVLTIAPIRAKEFSKKLKIDSKKISAQLYQIYCKTNLVLFKKHGRNKLWYRAYEFTN